jgi:hypothetical protein
MSVTAKIVTRPVVMNGTRSVRLGSIVINASSSGQNIRNVAFNESVAQIQFDREGSVKLIVNSSVKPTQVFADNMVLSEAQSVAGLTPESEAWVYDQTSHTITIFADPSSVTLIYSLTPTPPTSTQVPEFPTELGLVLVACLVAALMIKKNMAERSHKEMSSEEELPQGTRISRNVSLER